MKTKLTELRRKAKEANNAAIEIRDRNKDKDSEEWSAEDKTNFDKAVSDFRQYHTEANELEKQIKLSDELDQMHQFYSEPAPSQVQHRQPEVDPEKLATQRREAHSRLFRVFVRDGVNAAMRKHGEEIQKLYGPEEVNALLTSDDTTGGFLVPEDFKAEIIRWQAGFAAIRPMARVIMTNRDTAVFPKVAKRTASRSNDRYSTGFTGDWKAQAPSATSPGNPPTTQTQPTFEQERIPVHAWRPDAIEVSFETLQDTPFNLEQMLQQVIAETKAIDEDEAFLNGTGVGEPEGLLNAGITTVGSAASGALSYEGIVNLVHKVPAQYRQRGKFLMNSLTYGKLLQVQDGAGNYVIPAYTAPGMLWTKEVRFHEGMANVSAGNTAIIFGDFNQYVIAEREDLRVQRLVESYAPNVGLLPWARLGGQVVQVGAFRAQIINS